MNKNPKIILVTGIPGAGKSTFADHLEASGLGYTHVPLDRYIKPLPDGTTFLDWVNFASCIDWLQVGADLSLLARGEECFAPRGIKIDGSPRHQPQKTMLPGSTYVIAGTHSFAYTGCGKIVARVYIEIDDQALAVRYAGVPVEKNQVKPILTKYLGNNDQAIRKLRPEADVIIAGDDTDKDQIVALHEALELNRPTYSRR